MADEWTNYRRAYRGAGRRLRAIRAFTAAGVGKAAWKLGHRLTRPSGLSAADVTLKPALQPRRLPRVPAPGRPFPADVLTWAQTHKVGFERLVARTAPTSTDPEDVWSPHQFAWLLALSLSDDPPTDAAVSARITAWIDAFGDAPEDPGWRAYSISERTCIWIILSTLHDLQEIWPRMVESMSLQARDLLRNLEEYRDGSTNNHLLNNARALYEMGVLLGDAALADVGRRLFLDEIPRHVVPGGMLGEGSAHYHLIATKGILEAAWAAQVGGDDEMVKTLTPYARAMVAVADILRDEQAPAEWKVPLIGNVSPDFPPALLGPDLAFWSLLRDRVDIAPWWSKSNAERRLFEGGYELPAAGLFAWSGAGWRAWWHLRRSGVHRKHAHNDWGSIVLHHEGQPLLIDPGRAAYHEPTRYDGRRTLNQNALEVDGFEHTPLGRRAFFDPAYFRDFADVEMKADGGAARLSVAFHGYERLARPVGHVREFALTRTEVSIVDRLSGDGEHRIRLAWHFHPDIDVAAVDGAFVMTAPDGRRWRFRTAGEARLKRGGDVSTPGGWATPRYGAPREMTSILVVLDVTLPTTLEHVLVPLDAQPSVEVAP